ASWHECACGGSDPGCGRNSPTNFEHRWCRSGCEPRCQTSLVNDSGLIRARAGDQQAFTALTDPYRRELQLHCYRILGQVQDAEDAVQETLLSAWSALESFEERSTLRSWLYRIATHRCLNMLRDSGRRPATTVAPRLDTTPTSVNSALIRARATIEDRRPRSYDRAPLPRSAQEHELVARFADAFERGDVEPIVALLAEDAWWTMPPEPYG